MEKSEAYRLRKAITDLYVHIKNRLEVGGMPLIADAIYGKVPVYMEIKERARELFDYIVDNDEIRLAEVFAKLDENIIEQRFEQCFSKELGFDTHPEIREMLNVVNSIYMEMAILIKNCKEYVVDAQPYQTTDAQNFNTEQKQAAPELQQELEEILPDKLKDNEAVIIFQKAIDANLIIKTNNSLVWNDTKQLLAYFAEKMSNKFFLINKYDKDENKMVDWKTFEFVFCKKGLSGAKQNWMRLNTKFAPTGFEKIDVLFK